MQLLVHLLLFNLILSASASPLPLNHVIKFEGMSYGYNDTSMASLELLTNLKRITGRRDIVIDSMDGSSATWHSELLAQSTGECPESDIRALFAKIKAKDGDYTRTFKMELTENFLPPKSAFIEWLGICENVARKRSQTDEVPVAPTVDLSTTETASDATATAATSTPIPNTTPDTTQSTPDISTTTPATATSTLTASEATTDSIEEDLNAALIATTTTTVPATNVSATTEAVAPAITSPTLVATTESSSLVTEPKENLLMAATANIGATKVPATNVSAAVSSTTSSTTLSATTESISTTIKPTASSASEPASTPDTTSPPLQETTTIQQPMALKESESATSGSSSLADSGPHYGKYIALSAGILVIIAYIVCSRAYKKHGNYELHSE